MLPQNLSFRLYSSNQVLPPSREISGSEMEAGTALHVPERSALRSKINAIRAKTMHIQEYIAAADMRCGFASPSQFGNPRGPTSRVIQEAAQAAIPGDGC